MTGIIQLVRFIISEAICEQLLRFNRPGLFAARTHYDRDQSHVVTLGGGHQTIACGVSPACFHAIHIAVAKEQRISISLTDIVIGKFSFRIHGIELTVSLNGRGGKNRQISG